MMNKRQLTLVIMLVSMYLLVGVVSAQANLVANTPRDNQHIWGSESVLYTADLEAGHWTVVVASDSFWGLEVKITIARDSLYTDIIAESGTESGNFPRIGL
jgi:hypothetical protein